MANVIQAAKWMQEGKTVIDPDGFLHKAEGGVIYMTREDGKVDEDPAWVYIEDLLSDEWELAE